MKEDLRWRRVVLKLSGELLGGESGPLEQGGFSFYAREIAHAREAGAELAVVIGGGNIARGDALTFLPGRAGHAVGMLATLINGLALREVLTAAGLTSELMSAVPWPGVAEPVDPWRGRELLASGKVLILAGGTGSPFVTTDTAAVIRALALEAEAVLKGSKVAGVFTSDPVRDPQAQPIARLSPADYLKRGLKVMDQAAVAIAGAHNLPIYVFQAKRPGALLAALRGEGGSLIG